MENFTQTYYNNEQILNIAQYILGNQTTIRATAKFFNIPKSTVHHHLTTKLKSINYGLFKEIKKLMTENFKIKHIHGGESTKKKYEKLKENININDDIVAINF